MSAIRSTGNRSTELSLVAILRGERISGWRRGQPLPGKPDFVFRRERVAVFVDGCFWHGCPKHYRLPKSNQSYWGGKVSANQMRDREVGRQLRRLGWSVVRIWEHDLKRPHAVAKRVRRELEKRGR